VAAWADAVVRLAAAGRREQPAGQGADGQAVQRVQRAAGGCVPAGFAQQWLDREGQDRHRQRTSPPQYQLTPAGRHALDTERSTWRDFSAAVTALLQPAPPAVSPS
jgi:hypothetical protein